MEELNNKLYNILELKKLELQELLKTKTRKMTKQLDNDTINYCVKTTIAKINAEQDKKLKSSKTYKKQDQYSQALHQCSSENNKENVENEIIKNENT